MNGAMIASFRKYLKLEEKGDSISQYFSLKLNYSLEGLCISRTI